MSKCKVCVCAGEEGACEHVRHYAPARASTSVPGINLQTPDSRFAIITLFCVFNIFFQVKPYNF